MSKQFEQLKLLYKQALSTTLEIKNLIKNFNFDEAVSRDMHKAQLIKKATLAKKTVALSEIEEKELDNLIKNISEQDLENLKQTQEIKNLTEKTISTDKKRSKISSKYAQTEPLEGSVIDYNE